MIEFAEFLRARGFMPKDLIPDGRIRRCSTEAHPHKKNGAYMWAGSWAWAQDWSCDLEPVIWQNGKGDTKIDLAEMRKMQSARQKQIVDGQHKAAQKAMQIVNACRLSTHLYLARKGFAEELCMVNNDNQIIIPMRDCQNYANILSIQSICEDGSKKFLFGGRTKGAVFLLGKKSTDTILCEGFATGLSILAAVKMMHLSAQVCVCFSAANLAHVAGLLTGRRLIVADNDSSGTGERFAVATGLPWGMPVDVDTDANDLHMRNGVFALGGLLQEIARK